MTRLRSASAQHARLRFGHCRIRPIVGAVWTAAFVMIAGGSTVLACPVCFGAEETSMIDGAKLGVLVMLAITLAVQGAFVGFFLYLRKRAKRSAEIELDTEWSELQRASRTS
jgi:heme/copper-type cytochrome/quinol oxidase subunit 2